MTEIIVYRNPAEAALWQMLSGGARGEEKMSAEFRRETRYVVL